MSNDLLPEWLNLILDDVETTLCLPILIVIVLCTAQFIFNHSLDIGYTFYQNVKKSSDDDDDDVDKLEGGGVVNKIKGFLSNIGIGASPYVKTEENMTLPTHRTNPGEEEWDYCEEDDE